MPEDEIHPVTQMHVLEELLDTAMRVISEMRFPVSCGPMIENLYNTNRRIHAAKNEVTRCIPMVLKAYPLPEDPEFKRILAEEEEIERRTRENHNAVPRGEISRQQIYGGP